MPARSVERVLVLTGDDCAGFTAVEMREACRDIAGSVIGPDLWVPVAIQQRADIGVVWLARVELYANQRNEAWARLGLV